MARTAAHAAGEVHAVANLVPAGNAFDPRRAHTWPTTKSDALVSLKAMSHDWMTWSAWVRHRPSVFFVARGVE